MLDQVRVQPPTIFVFDVTSVRSFIFDLVIDGKVYEKYSKFQILIGGHAHYGIAWDVELRHVGLGIVAMFKYEKPHIITLIISIGSKSNNAPFFIARIFSG